MPPSAAAPDLSVDELPEVLSRSELEDAVSALSTDAAISLVYVRVEEQLPEFERPFDLDLDPATSAVLDAVASRLQRLARETDLVGRWTVGDFVIIGPGERAAPSLARRIHASFQDPSRTAAPLPSIDVSIGWTTAPGRWRLAALAADASERLGPVQLRLRSRLAQLGPHNGTPESGLPPRETATGVRDGRATPRW